MCVCDSIVVPAGQCQWLEHIGSPLLPPTDTLLVGFIALCVTAECVYVREHLCPSWAVPVATTCWADPPLSLIAGLTDCCMTID